MGRPTKFRAGGFNWKVEYFLHKDWPTEDDSKMGVSHVDMHKVHIRLSDKEARYGEGAIKETLLHELMHVCYFISGRDHEDTFKEEDTIRFLSPTLLAVLRDNLPVARYLLAE